MNKPNTLRDIGIYAPLMSGKTLCAQHLCEEYGYTRLPFANEVKIAAANMLDDIREVAGYPSLSVQDINEHKSVYRPVLQWLGTDYVRKHLKQVDFWVDRWVERYEDMRTLGPVVVDDLRFPNEAFALRRHGFRFLSIQRSESQRFDQFLATTQHDAISVGPMWEEMNAHDSEQHYDEIEDIVRPFMAYVDNNDSDDVNVFYSNIEEAVLDLTYRVAELKR